MWSVYVGIVTFVSGVGHEVMDGGRAGALAVDRDSARVSPETADVGLDPPQGEALVLEPHVAGHHLVPRR